MIKIKLDLSKLTDEITFESRFINSQEDLNTELGWSEIRNAIMDKIEVVKEEFVKCK